MHPEFKSLHVLQRTPRPSSWFKGDPASKGNGEGKDGKGGVSISLSVKLNIRLMLAVV